MDPVDVKSYRPISNLSVLTNLLERFVCKQLVKYLTDNHAFFLIASSRTEDFIPLRPRCSGY